MSAANKPTISGGYAADGVARTIETLGFRPQYIKFINLTTGATAEWTDKMDDLTVVTHDSGTDAIDTAQGVTRLTDGFSIGTNAVINNSGDDMRYVAWG